MNAICWTLALKLHWLEGRTDGVYLPSCGIIGHGSHANSDRQPNLPMAIIMTAAIYSMLISYSGLTRASYVTETLGPSQTWKPCSTGAVDKSRIMAVIPWRDHSSLPRRTLARLGLVRLLLTVHVDYRRGGVGIWPTYPSGRSPTWPHVYQWLKAVKLPLRDCQASLLLMMLISENVLEVLHDATPDTMLVLWCVLNLQILSKHLKRFSICLRKFAKAGKEFKQVVVCCLGRGLPERVEAENLCSNKWNMPL